MHHSALSRHTRTVHTAPLILLCDPIRVSPYPYISPPSLPTPPPYPLPATPLQLLVLHSEAPDYDPNAETKGSGIMTGATATTLAEKERLAWLQTLYAERRRWRPGDQRFCAPGVATAAVVGRFASGLPAALAELPVKVIAVVRARGRRALPSPLRAQRARACPAHHPQPPTRPWR